jgi:RimJ/RimL family protein N-acetyltransferase
MERLETRRLLLRAPRLNDAQPIFERYAADPEVTRYLAWPRHASIAATRAFVEFSNTQWKRWNAGPMLVISRDDGTLLGGAGLLFETAEHASTGYVLARDAWGNGYATEALEAMVAFAAKMGVQTLTAECHCDHRRSRRVLEKCGFELDALTKRQMVFPNLSPEPQGVSLYSKKTGSGETGSAKTGSGETGSA